MKTRIDFIDGLRCVAVVLVVAYHYLHATPIQFPEISYELTFADLFFAKYGALGVQLFFVISGFVITQSLHNSSSLGDFAVRRFARLWPVMALCSAITYLVSFIHPATYESISLNFLPSLTFLDPKVFQFALRNPEISWMDGSYWTLFSEIRFYAIVAIIFFLSKKWFFFNFTGVLILSSVLYCISLYYQLTNLRTALYYLSIANLLPWFSIGIGFYYFYIRDRTKYFLLFSISIVAITLNPLVSVGTKYAAFHAINDLIDLAVVFPLVFASFNLSFLQKALAFRPLSLIGLSSYSLYLIHQNVGEKIIIILGNPLNLSVFGAGLYAVFVFTLVALFSQIVYRYFESPINKSIVNAFRTRSSQTERP